MKKTFKMLGLYLLVTLVVAVGIVFLMPMPINASNDDWEDPLPPAPTNHLLDIVGNLMNLHDANVTADLTINTGDAAIAVTANVNLQATDGFADVTVAGDLGLTLNDFATNLHVTYTDQTFYADWNNLHLKVSVPALIDGLPALLKLFGVDFTMPDFGSLDVNALLGLLENYSETDNGNGFDVILTVAGCDLALTCDVDYNLQRAVIPGLTFGDTTLAGEIALTIYETPLALTVPDEPYVDVLQLVQLFTDLAPVFNQPFAIQGNAQMFATVDGVRQLDNYLTADLGRLAIMTRNNLLDQLAIDLAVGGEGELFNTILGGRALTLGAYFNGDTANYPDQSGVYVNFDGLKLFCAKADLADTYRALQNLLSLFVSDDLLDYTKLFYFNANNDMVFDTTVLNNLLGNLATADITTLLNTYLPYLSGLTLTADNVLTLTLANDWLTLTLYPDADGVYHVSVASVLADQNREIVAELTLQTVDAFAGLPTDTDGNFDTSYLDVSAIDDLLNAVNNTVRHDEFYLSGTVHLSVASIITVDVPVTVAINNTDPDRGLAVAVKLSLPYKGLPKLVLDKAPSATGETQDGYRDLYIYYQQGYIYLYRTEQVKLTEWSWKQFANVTIYEGLYQKAIKLTPTQFMDNALNYLLVWGFGFKQSIMDEINKAIANNGANDQALNYGNIIHGFTANDGKYDLILNLGEIAHNPDLGDFTVTIATDNNGEQSVVTALGVNMQINVASIVLQTTGDGLTLTTGDGVADVTTADERIAWFNHNEPQGAEGETWQTIKGVWEKAA